MTRDERVWLAVTIVITGFVCAAAFHYFLGVQNRLGYPFETFLFSPHDAAMDYFNILDATRGLDPYRSRLAVYFPLTYVPFALLLPLPRPVGLLVFVAFFTVVTLHFMARQLAFLEPYQRRAATIALTLPTYPFLFCVDRANVEMIVFALLCFFFLAFERERWRSAAFWLACATAMKLYPGVFAILFLRRKQYRAFFASIAFTIGLSLASVFLYDGGLARAVRGMATNLAFFHDRYILGFEGFRFNSSWFGALRFLAASYAPDLAARAADFILPYTIVCVLLFAAISMLVLRRAEMPFWQQVLLLCFPMILFPEVSFDYKLIHCLFPIAFFLKAPETAPRDRIFVVLLSAMLVPKAYVWINGGSDVNIGLFLHPALMTILMLLAIARDSAARERAQLRGDELAHRPGEAGIDADPEPAIHQRVRHG